MNSLTPSMKIGVLRGLSNKIGSGSFGPKIGSSSLAPASSNPKDPVSARLQRKINPDYAPTHAYNLNKKLF